MSNFTSLPATSVFWASYARSSLNWINCPHDRLIKASLTSNEVGIARTQHANDFLSYFMFISILLYYHKEMGKLLLWLSPLVLHSGRWSLHRLQPFVTTAEPTLRKDDMGITVWRRLCRGSVDDTSDVALRYSYAICSDDRKRWCDRDIAPGLAFLDNWAQ